VEALMRYLLDTNTLIYIINKRPRHTAVLERFSREEPQDLCVSAITLAELRYGIAKSKRSEANRRAFVSALETLRIAPFDADAAERYGMVRAELEASGRPIGPLDMLIAAHALSLGVTLVTNNQREFSRVHRLRLENWIPS
jgi:tRNA(fMet)-specific endonuclease VapC